VSAGSVVRNPRTQPGDNYTGLVPMTRCNWSGVAFESMLEMDWLIQTDAFTYGLREVKAQPCRIKYWFDGKYRRWTPDFLRAVEFENRPCLVEVKTLRALYPKDPEKRAWIRGKFAALEQAANNEGYGFVLATENEIRIQPRLHNAGLMTSVATRYYPETSIRAGIDAVLALPKKSSVCGLQQALGLFHDGFEVALYLAWRGLIRLDPAVEWSRETTFVRTKRKLS
jgi:hypothetical protein